METKNHQSQYSTKKDRIYKTNVCIIYHSLLEDYGFSGIKRIQGALGIPVMGNYKYARYLRYIYEQMQHHFEEKQLKVFAAIKKYYNEEMKASPDEFGIYDIDISYDGTWMKRGHTSHIGMAVIIEV